MIPKAIWNTNGIAAFQRTTLALLLALLFWPALAAAQAPVIPDPRQQWLTNTGAPCNGCTLTTYLAGTSTAQALYTDSALSIPAPNPITMNSAGRPCSAGSPCTELTLYQPAVNLKYVLATSAGTILWTADNVRATNTSVVPASFAVGDLLTANTTSTLARLADVATGSVLVSGGVGVIPAWSATPTVTTLNTGQGNNELFAMNQAVQTTDAPSFNQFRPPSGRCTLTTAVPVTTGDVTAATTLFYALYSRGGGNQLTLYDGSTRWVQLPFTQLSIAVPATTDTMYDVFIDYTAGVPVMELVAWTNLTTRATALATQNGVYVQTADTDSLYVCSFRTTGVSGQTEDSFAKRFVWNYYNRVKRGMRNATETADSWTYTTNAWRQANASSHTNNQLAFVIGVSEDHVNASVLASASNDNAGVLLYVGIGLDSTSAIASGSFVPRIASPVANISVSLLSSWVGLPGVGSHTLVWLERSGATGTSTFFGDDGDPLRFQSGIQGEIWN